MFFIGTISIGLIRVWSFVYRSVGHFSQSVHIFFVLAASLCPSTGCIVSHVRTHMRTFINMFFISFEAPMRDDDDDSDLSLDAVLSKPSALGRLTGGESKLNSYTFIILSMCWEYYVVS